MNVRSHATALAEVISDALIIEHLGGPGTFVHRTCGLVSLPEFTVCRGYIISDEGEAPRQEPPMTEDEELRANVRALKNYHDRLIKAALGAKMAGPMRTLIIFGQHPELDSLSIAMWVY